MARRVTRDKKKKEPRLNPSAGRLRWKSSRFENQCDVISLLISRSVAVDEPIGNGLIREERTRQ